MTEKAESEHEISGGRLKFVAQEIANNDRFQEARSASSEGFWQKDARLIRRAVSLVLEEKEILVFSALQWVAIGIVYYIWVQFLSWIPIEVWESDDDLAELGINLVFLAWSFACVGVAAFFIGLLTGAMSAAHLLRSEGKASTLASCLSLSFRSVGSLWIFQWIDSWITTERILARLPKRGWWDDLAWLAATEVLYYAWKTATMAIVPALVTGKGLIDAGKGSVGFVLANAGLAVRMRAAYSLLCWIVGIATYIGTVFFLGMVDAFDTENWVYGAYVWAGVPLIVAVGVIKMFIRPVFVLATCIAYIEFTHERGEHIALAQGPGRFERVLIPFVLLLLAIAFVYIFRDAIGLSQLLEHPGGS
jgi:hypothetical protein